MLANTISRDKKKNILTLLGCVLLIVIGAGIFYLGMKVGVKRYIATENPERFIVEKWRSKLSKSCEEFTTFEACGYYRCWFGVGAETKSGSLAGYVKVNNTAEAETTCPKMYPGSYHFEQFAPSGFSKPSN